jgi:hypothetical protein
MSFPEPSDPTLDLLRLLPDVSPHADATARVRRRCHAVLARRAARRALGSRSVTLRAQLLEAAWLLPLGLYLLISVIETVRVASSL